MNQKTCGLNSPLEIPMGLKIKKLFGSLVHFTELKPFEKEEKEKERRLLFG